MAIVLDRSKMVENQHGTQFPPIWYPVPAAKNARLEGFGGGGWQNGTELGGKWYRVVWTIEADLGSKLLPNCRGLYLCNKLLPLE